MTLTALSAFIFQSDMRRWEMVAKWKPSKLRINDKERALVLERVEGLVAAGLAIRYPGDMRIRLLTGELYAFTEEGVVRVDQSRLMAAQKGATGHL
jgi:hypothetical protein